MNNVYTDPYMPDEEDLVEVGDLRPWGHEVHYKQGISQKVLKQRAKENAKAEEEWLGYDRKTKQHPNARDNRILCNKTSPWADCIDALEIYESKTP
jgi:hypothetical protein